MDRLNHLIAYVQEQPWALHPRVLAQMADVLGYRSSGYRLTIEEVREKIAAEGDGTDVQALNAQHDRAASRGRERGVAVIPVFGIIAQHAHMVNDMSGPRGVATQTLSQRIREAVENPDIDAIVLNVHSPGGSVYGVGELAAEIRAYRKQKPITAVANSEMASAAYYIGSAATDVSVTPNGRVGSIGVWSAHEDMSKALEAEGVKVTLLSRGKFKVAGNPFEPLSDEAREIMQGNVDHYYDLFINAVARGRNVPVSEVRDGFGEGSMVFAKQAVAEKMADRVETLEEAIQRVGRENAPRRGARAEDFPTVPDAAIDAAVPTETNETVEDSSRDEELDIAARVRVAESELIEQQKRLDNSGG